MRTIAGQAPRECCGRLTFPTAAPISSLCVTYWLVTRNEPVPDTGAQRDTPELPASVQRQVAWTACWAGSRSNDAGSKPPASFSSA